MRTKSDEPLFRIIFNQNGKIYEVYARSLTDDTMMGFIQVEELVFGDESSVVIDPTEEKLRNEFKDVDCIYIPLHHVIRIDEVAEKGVAKIREVAKESSNVSPLPFMHARQLVEKE